MEKTLIVSDIHLSDLKPEITQYFLGFLKTLAGQAQYLYILGDLFDYWIGDEEIKKPSASAIVKSLKEVSKSGTDIFLLHGNRDFLLGEKFANAAGLKIINEETPVNLYDNHLLLMHGDTLCTDDVDYQEFRTKVHNKNWQNCFLAKPIEERQKFARYARATSEKNKAVKSAEIMDVNNDTVRNIFRKHNFRTLIHGHTHRPAHHTLIIDGVLCNRYVLPDWDTGGGYLQCDQTGCQIIFL